MALLLFWPPCRRSLFAGSLGRWMMALPWLLLLELALYASCFVCGIVTAASLTIVQVMFFTSLNKSCLLCFCPFFRVKLFFSGKKVSCMFLTMKYTERKSKICFCSLFIAFICILYLIFYGHLRVFYDI